MKADSQFIENTLYITCKKHQAVYVKCAFKSAMTAITTIFFSKKVLQGLKIKQ
jgi:hypothetical protein